MEKHNDRIDINSETKANLQSENAGLKEEMSDIINYQIAYEKKVKENSKYNTNINKASFGLIPFLKSLIWEKRFWAKT
jgi:septal ring factor EnvC (AmiA/AmiB activator)